MRRVKGRVIGDGKALYALVGCMVLIVALLLCYKAIEDSDSEEDSSYIIDVDEHADGISFKYNGEDKLVVHMEYNNNNNKHNCYIYNDGYAHDVKFTYGDGTYKVKAYISDELYYSKSIDFDGNIDWTTASYNVEMDKYCNTVSTLVDNEGWTSCTNLETIFNFFKKFEYDYEMEESINEGIVTELIPKVDETIKSRKGVCFDIASAMACSLRYVGFDARLCVGITRSGKYHAWCEVYDTSSNEWKNLDTILKSDYNNGMCTEALAIQYY